MFTIVGFKRVVAKSNSAVYYELHLTGEDRYVTGLMAFNVFVKEDMINKPEQIVPGSFCDIYYNRFGKVDRIFIM